MSKNLGKIFDKWNELNNKAQQFLGQFNFLKIKEIRQKQNTIEDSLFEFLKQNAKDKIKALLPNDCGQMEVGFDTEGKIFYFVMEDPDFEDEEQLVLLAITLDSEENIDIIKNFKIED